ncbi:response regulator [bacterium]|nr:response regulator [bacterium]
MDKELKILIVDDSPGIRMVAKKIFDKLGFTNVSLADDGTTALETLKVNAFDLVIADMNMPKMPGIELLSEMKKSERLKDIPFLLVTAEEKQDEIMTAIKAGVSNYMPKPWNMKTLMKKMERIFAFEQEKKKRPKMSENF